LLLLLSSISLSSVTVFALGPNEPPSPHSASFLHPPQRQRRFSSASLPPSFDFHPLLAPPASQNASGVRVRLFPRGVEALNLVASNLLATQLPKILIPNVEHRLPSDQGVINISKIRMSRFKRASVHNISMKAPNRVLWEMRNVDIGLIGDLSGQTNIVVPLELTGEAEILAEGLDLTIESEMERSPEGSARVQTLYCSSSIRAVEVINHNGGVFGLAVTVFKAGIGENVRSMLERIICKEIKKYVEEDLNVKLAEVQTKSPLSNAVRLNSLKAKDLHSRDTKGFTSFTNFFDKDFSSDFYIDYRLKENPQCGENVIDLGSSGEISYKGLGDTPFGPVAIPPPEAENEMLALSLSDFVLNSLFYHAYKQRKLRIFLDSKTKGAASMLRTKCDGGFCLGDLIPQLGEGYPNATLAMLFSATRSPAAIFSERNGGILSMRLGGLLAFYVEELGRKRQIALFNVDVIVSAQLSIVKGNIRGTITLDRFDLVKKYGELRISKEELDDIAILSSQFIEGMLNELFATGFPLPVPQVLHLDNLHLKIRNRHVVLLTDFSIDEHRLNRIASAALFPFIPKSPNAPSFSSLLDIEPERMHVDSSARVARLQLNPQQHPQQSQPLQSHQVQHVQPVLQLIRPGAPIPRSVVYVQPRQLQQQIVVRDGFVRRRRYQSR
ncbi:hypothetical protein PENTCL1PPCAC_16287, partial [Pristionchus entomophagus]